MKLTGTFQLAAERARVWQLLLDPQVLRSCLPGCEQLEPVGEDQYKAVLNLRLGGIKGVYKGEVHLREKRPQEHFLMVVAGQGTGGFVNGSGSIDLIPAQGGTELRYSGDFQVGGLLASVGSRLVDSVAKKVTREFLEKLAQEVSSAAG